MRGQLRADTSVSKPTRFRLVDSLRGLAALAVLGFHLHQPGYAEALGSFLPSALLHGWLGVQVFFVLSGFVIAHSLRNVEGSPAFFGRFVLRRSVRLDPPYWATILLALGSLLASNVLFSERRLPLPGVAAISSHLFYLQDILAQSQIIDVFWTLCLEFQLYLVFAAMLVGGCALEARLGRAREWGILASAVPALLLLASFWAAARGMPADKTWFLRYWYQFFLGALTYWVTTGRAHRATLAAALVGCLAVALDRSAVEPLVAGAVASVLWLAALRGGLTTWLAWRPLQWLGRISYSLYLTHTLVVSRGWNGLLRIGWLHDRSLLGGVALGACALLFADIWYRIVERPALRLSRRIPLRSRSRPEIEPAPRLAAPEDIPL